MRKAYTFTDDSFEPGDLVQLRSGGPIMTVDKVFKDKESVFAAWFAHGKRWREAFSVASLLHAGPKGPGWQD